MKNGEAIKCVFERVYVETPVDTDGDGYADLIAVYIRRPVSRQKPVPAVMVANPYLMFCNEEWYDLYNVDKELKAYPQQDIKEEDIRFDFDGYRPKEPLYRRETAGYADSAAIEENVEFECISPLYAWLNQKGYASVFTGGLGTRGSDGYTLSGSREEVLAFKSVIDWLNGRCRAFTNRTDNIEIRADWCTGKVAMSAKSYLGTMCIGVAATGVEGLEAIIPEAGICSWYEYYRTNGLVVPPLEWQGDDINVLARYCFSRAKDEEDYAAVSEGYTAALNKLAEAADRDSGNYSRFWDERNYLNQIENIHAAVFIIHGLNDWNVKTNQCGMLFKALEEHGKDRRILLHQGKHVYVYDLDGINVPEMIERWLDHYLRGADNGVEQEPKALVESNLDQTCWMASENWPPAEVTYVQFPVEKEKNTAVIEDSLKNTVYRKEDDNQQEWLDELVSEANAGGKLRFEWDPFSTEKQDLRISGSVRVSFAAAVDQKTVILSAMLVDMGTERRYTGELEDILLSEQHPSEDEGRAWIMGTGPQRFAVEEKPSSYRVISRVSMNAQNRNNNYCKEEIEPGIYYHYHMEMVPTDYTLKRGHRLVLIVYGIDAQQTLRQETVTRITVDLSTLDVQVPFVQDF